MTKYIKPGLHLSLACDRFH